LVFRLGGGLWICKKKHQKPHKDSGDKRAAPRSARRCEKFVAKNGGKKNGALLGPPPPPPKGAAE